MYVTDDPQYALELWNADETQWIITDGVAYAVAQEMDAFHAMMTTHWRLTSPEELASQLAA